MNGVDLMTVKQLLGHKDIKMTMRYSHLSPDHKRVETVFRREMAVYVYLCFLKFSILN